MSKDEHRLTSRLGWFFAVLSVALLLYGTLQSHVTVSERHEALTASTVATPTQSTAFGL